MKRKLASKINATKRERDWVREEQQWNEIQQLCANEKRGKYHIIN